MPIPSQLPNLFGDFDSRDLPAIAATDVPQVDLYRAVREAVDAYNEVSDETLSFVADTSTVAKESFEFGLDLGVGGMMQEASEYSRPLATRTVTVEPASFDVGYPIAAFRDRHIFTPHYLMRANLEQINALVWATMIRDYQLLFRSILTAVFNNVNYTFKDRKPIGQGLGDLNVKRLLNADGQPGTITVGGTQVALGVQNHYKTSGNAVFTNQAFDIAYNQLATVGMATDVVFLISNAQVDQDAVKALSNFVSKDTFPENDPRIIYDPAETRPATIRAIVESPRAIGRIKNRGEVQVSTLVPAGYFMAVDRGSVPPVRIRESDIGGLSGLRLTDQDDLANPKMTGNEIILNKYFERIFGAGVRNRANAVIVQITANATYTPPVFFTPTA